VAADGADLLIRWLAAVGALALVATGCGGGGKSASGADIARAASKTAHTGSLEADFTIAGQGLEGRGSGVFDSKKRSGQLSMKVTANGRETPVDTIVTGDVFYMRSPVFARAVGRDKQWVKLDLGTITQQRGVDLSGLLDASPTPTNALAYLEGSVEVKKVGAESVGGVSSTHYQVTADLRRAVERASGGARRSLQQVIAQTGLRKLPLDVWVDGSGYIRRVKYDEHSGRRQAAHVSIELHDFGASVSIKPPPSDSVVDLLQRLQQGT
jgi:hypothetical protein